MASRRDLLPWCAAKMCPATFQQGCLGYINEHSQNRTAQSFVACCKIQCGQIPDAMIGLAALECGGATTATAVGTISYLVLLIAVGCYILAVGPFLRMKNVTYWIITIGSLIFVTGTLMFVTNVTSPFMVLRSVPALGAMNVAVFFYFYAGFHYGVALAYESAPLVVFATTSFSICKALLRTTLDGPAIRTANNLALTMLVFTFLWIVHSISFRIYGYRVEWRLAYKAGPENDQNQRRRDGPNSNGQTARLYQDESSVKEPSIQDPRFQLGAAQGHPTWRTPMGQSTGLILTGLSWSMVKFIWEDVADQKCRPDLVFYTMLLGAPILITATIFWNVFSGTRCRKISGQKITKADSIVQGSTTSRTRRWLGNGLGQILPRFALKLLGLSEYAHTYTYESWSIVTGSSQISDSDVATLRADYPGYNSYKYYFTGGFHGFWSRFWSRFNHVWSQYVQAAALQRMERNSLHIENVPDKRLLKTDKVIGCTACFLAHGGLLISFPGFFIMMGVAELVGRILEICPTAFRILVETYVTTDDRQSAVEVVEKCYVGADVGEEKMTWNSMKDTVFGASCENRRSINLHTLLDNTGPCELYNLLTLNAIACSTYEGTIGTNLEVIP
ncbi:hypothetical protein KC19_11G095100 [Ceratodon purpureus]|uniref:Uncharacterized protein n=1 Tax=Ceratodon purpureus TaxID=3225 RepID=A0A8T0GFR0_CERPU|nr:hypothetical protein KC19_11G095100 [Ceratodon purpureus]